MGSRTEILRSSRKCQAFNQRQTFKRVSKTQRNDILSQRGVLAETEPFAMPGL